MSALISLKGISMFSAIHDWLLSYITREDVRNQLLARHASTMEERVKFTLPPGLPFTQSFFYSLTAAFQDRPFLAILGPLVTALMFCDLIAKGIAHFLR